MKKTLSFSTLIAAPRERVWELMTADASYRDWTSAFSEGSYYEGSWDEGATIRFLGPGGTGGMVATIAENRPLEFISIKHLGVIENGVEDRTSEAVRAWVPAFEDYSFIDRGLAGTELRVDIEITPDYEEFMQKAWPQALARLKTLCENP